MTTLFQDPSLTQPDASSVLQTPGQSAPGIGLGSPQPGLGIASPNVAQDALKQRYDAMPLDQKIFTGLGEVGAALKGNPSPMAVQDQTDQKNRMNNLKILQDTTQALQDGYKTLQGLQGADRTAFADSWGASLDQTKPGMGNLFKAYAKNPSILDTLEKYATQLPASIQQRIRTDPYGAIDWAYSPAGQTVINTIAQAPMLKDATQRGTFLIHHLSQLVTPETAALIHHDGPLTTADFIKINDDVKNNPEHSKLAIPDDVMNQIGDNPKFLSALNLLDSNSQQDVLKKQAEEGLSPTAFQKDSSAYQKMVDAGNGNSPEALRLKANLDRRDAPTTVMLGGKAPAGYRNSADGKGLEYIPGGPADPNAQHGQIGAREAVFLNRTLVGANEAAKDLSNIVQGPISQSTGFFGGRGQAPGLMNAGQEALTNQMTSQEVQSYNVMSAGFQRSLAAIESAGLAPNGLLSHQMDAVAFKEGDTNLTKLQKLAQTRQIIEAGLESTLSNPRVPEEQKKHIQSVIGEVQKAVPFTHTDILKMQNAQAINPNATLKSVMNTVTSGGSAMPDASAIDAEIARRKSEK